MEEQTCAALFKGIDAIQILSQDNPVSKQHLGALTFSREGSEKTPYHLATVKTDSPVERTWRMIRSTR